MSSPTEAPGMDNQREGVVKPKILGMLMAGVLAAPLTAGAVVLDFNSATTFPHAEDGFVVQTSSGLANFGACSPPCANDGSRNIFVGGRGVSIDISAADGASFSLLRFDAGELFQGFDSTWSRRIDVTGWLVGGGSIVASFLLDFIHDGPGVLVDVETFLLPSSFANLTRVSFESGLGGGFTLDNVEVVAGGSVPEPGPLALFGLGLAGLVVRRRRATA
jgi:hypothetical protein